MHWVRFKDNEYGTKELNDIAVIRFQGDLPDGFRQVQILPTSDELQSGVIAEIAGYGPSSFEEMGDADSLKHLQVRIKGLEELPTRFAQETTSTGKIKNIVIPPFKSERRIEIILAEGQKMTYGDSGGPAYLIKDGTLFQWGVASSGGVYEMIFPHIEWIRSVIQ